MLGYRLERYLHDQAKPLDQYIPVLRKEFPLGGKPLSTPGSKPEEPSLVQLQLDKPAAWVARLDGLAIVNAMKGENVYPFGLHVQLPEGPKPLPETGDVAEIIKEGINDLQDCIDAMKD